MANYMHNQVAYTRPLFRRLCLLIVLCGSTLLLLFSYYRGVSWTVFHPRFYEPSLFNVTCGYMVRAPWVGRLGSEMFIYASFYGMVRKQRANKASFIHIWNTPYLLEDAFENLTLERSIISDSWLKAGNFNSLNEKQGCCTYDDSGIENMTCDGINEYIEGYRCSYKYFYHVVEEIRNEFTFRAGIRDKSELIFRENMERHGLKRNECVTVGVHLRRGDFTWKGPGHLPAQADYLKRAIRFYETKLYQRNGTGQLNTNVNCIAFLIFGDDYKWNKRTVGDVELLEPTRSHLIPIDTRKSSAAVDLCALTLSDHMIISTGTFGWWAGFFSRGNVTYQWDYAVPGSSHFYEYEPEDYFLPSWIPL